MAEMNDLGHSSYSDDNLVGDSVSNFGEAGEGLRGGEGGQEEAAREEEVPHNGFHFAFL
jgi:hypothetical protein